MRSRVLVVGNGMVSYRFCERMAEWDEGRRCRVAVIGEEPHLAYDRVRLTSYFDDRSAAGLMLGTREWYDKHGIELHVGTKAVSIERRGRVVNVQPANGGNGAGAAGATKAIAYDVLVLATGSSAAVLPVPGARKRGVFVYRTVDDLEAIARYATGARRAVIVGGGLLGLEAARAAIDLGLEAHVVELEPRLMPRQLDDKGSALLERSVRSLGVHVHLGERIAEICGGDAVDAVEFKTGEKLATDIVILAMGIVPRDELARTAGIATEARGGIGVDDRLRTSDPHVFAIGEVAAHKGQTYGLVAPGYAMADALAKNLCGGDAIFEATDMSAKLKLLGTDVATFGDPFASPGTGRAVVVEDAVRGVYQKFVFAGESPRLLGGILVGDTASYGPLLHATRTGHLFSEGLQEFHCELRAGRTSTSAEAPVCSCNNVSSEEIRTRIRKDDLSSIAQIKSCTKAGTGCGACIPQIGDLLAAELRASGRATKPVLCEHFAYTRQELFEIVRSRKIRTFAALIRAHGKGDGCEICKPTVASIFASTHHEPILSEAHRGLQDSNDRYLANIQKDGTYSVVPRIPGGEVSAEQLIALGQVAKKYRLYSKITGGQRVDLFGATVEQLPFIWEELIAAGFESGHAYGKAVRTVKSCVGSTWCRFGVQDSTAFAIRIEQRYKGIRAPHKLKSAVSGCARECAEAQSKDFGLVATERGWNIYVCGNGGVSPRHADLLASDVHDETVIQYLDRFLMFYIRTADRLTRTATWLDKMDGGIGHLKQVVVHDSLGIAADLERDMQALVDSYSCEWADVVNDPQKRAKFEHFSAKVSSPPPSLAPFAYEDEIAIDESLYGTDEERKISGTYRAVRRRLPMVSGAANAHARAWVRVAAEKDLPTDGGIAVRYGKAQIALFRIGSKNEIYATQNMCPHKQQMVLARGIVGDAAGTPKVACPMHKRTFDLRTGSCFSDDTLKIDTFPVRLDGTNVWVELPNMEAIAAPACEGVHPPEDEKKTLHPDGENSGDEAEHAPGRMTG
jgi:nitrite reductase (NADH) large subunit